ncbi:hypothetical protein Dimus_021282 [Dionaea muscipula]
MKPKINDCWRTSHCNSKSIGAAWREHQRQQQEEEEEEEQQNAASFPSPRATSNKYKYRMRDYKASSVSCSDTERRKHCIGPGSPGPGNTYSAKHYISHDGNLFSSWLPSTTHTQS